MVERKNFLSHLLIIGIITINLGITSGISLHSLKFLAWSEFEDISDQFHLEPNLQLRSWVGDLDNDTDSDVLIGTNQGKLQFFRNIGSSGNDLWNIDSDFSLPIPSKQVSRVVPTAGDLDGDNDIDIIIGCDDGHLYVSLNEGTSQIPAWTEFSILRNSNNEIFNFTGHANPTLIDYDNDTENLLDLIVGSDVDATTGRYQIYTYMNVGNLTHYSFGVVTYPWAGRKLPYGPKNITKDLLEINPSEDITGSMRVNFALISIDLRPDMILIFDSGYFSYFYSTGLTADPTFLSLDKEEASFVFNFPPAEEESFIDFQWYGSTDTNNITSTMPVSGGNPKILLFRNSGEVLFFPQSSNFSTENTSKISPSWLIGMEIFTFGLISLLLKKRKKRFI